MGTGWLSCAGRGNTFGCVPQGTVSLTTDGGKTWRVVLRTPRPVVAVGYDGTTPTARYDDGENLSSREGGRRWAPVVAATTTLDPCPPEMTAFVARSWVLCMGQGGAGSMEKSVYRFTANGVQRVAYTPFTGQGAYGGIEAYGYPVGISGADDGFGLIWESRGTLYVTRDGGATWTGREDVAQPEVDFGFSGCALPHGVGFVVLAKGGGEQRRLLETTDAGRSWHVVHTWS